MTPTTVFALAASLVTLTSAYPQAPPAPAALAGNPKWSLKDDYLSISPTDFFSRFDFFTAPDPTQGAINYVSQPDAEKQNLIGFYPTNNPSASTSLFQGPNGQSSAWAAYMSVDMTTPQQEKRNSVRISSKAMYNAPMMAVVSVDHLPLGLGTWPAFWMLGQGEWPAGGEIDIIEFFGTPAAAAAPASVNVAATGGPATLNNGPPVYGASLQGTPQSPSANSMALHTAQNCALQGNNSHTGYQGTLLQGNCDTYATPGNQGCQIKSPFGSVSGVTPGDSKQKSKRDDTTELVDRDVPQHQFATGGPGFNTQGGGVYATAWTHDGINIWFFPPTNIPPSLQGNGTNPDTSEFGTPLASFVGTGCDWEGKFKNMQILFNIALCGQAIPDKTWQADGRAQSSGAQTCPQYVAKKEGLQESWWGVRGLRVYGQ